MKNLLSLALILCSFLFIVNCGGNSNNNSQNTTGETPKSMVAENKSDSKSYDPKRGEGKFNAENVTVGALDQAMATKGEAIADTKCVSCHKKTTEKLVGPGWSGVTSRHEPYWIMNFITNPDPMINKDPKVQAQLELCLVRMPNQNLADEEARNILEFMRKNDGIK